MEHMRRTKRKFRPVEEQETSRNSSLSSGTKEAIQRMLTKDKGKATRPKVHLKIATPHDMRPIEKYTRRSAQYENHIKASLRPSAPNKTKSPTS